MNARCPRGLILEPLEQRQLLNGAPPATPGYNGSCEAGIGGLKICTRQQAAVDAWESRSPIRQAEPDRFRLSLQRIRTQIEEGMDPIRRES